MAVPYLIGSGGIEINQMLTHTGGHPVYCQRISTGIPRLDAMLGGGHRRSGRLTLSGLASRARSGESQHAEILRQIETPGPRVLVVDPLSALLKQGLGTVAMDIAYRLVRDCKVRGITLADVYV